MVGTQQVDLPESVLTEAPDLRAYAGRPVVLGIRPEDLGGLRPGDRDDLQAGCALRVGSDWSRRLGQNS